MNKLEQREAALALKNSHKLFPEISLEEIKLAESIVLSFKTLVRQKAMDGKYYLVKVYGQYEITKQSDSHKERNNAWQQFIISAYTAIQCKTAISSLDLLDNDQRDELNRIMDEFYNANPKKS